MKYETKRTIIKVTAGVAIAGALAAGITFGGPAIKDSIQYNNTQITYNNEDYKLKNLYVLKNENGSEICYKKAIDSETEISVGPGISTGNGFVVGMNGNFGVSIGGQSKPGSMTMGVVSKPKTIYGYISINTDELLAISGHEKEFGYEVDTLKTYIPFEVAKEQGFIITEDDMENLVPMTSGKSK